MSRPRRGNIFVISSPSGGGKTSTAECALQKIDGVERSVSMTTRPPRPGEKDGVDYLFATETHFKGLIRKNAFLEYAHVFDRYYGTPKKFVDQKIKSGIDLLLLIDVQGARTVKKNRPDAILIFLMPPSIDELRRRLHKRSTDSEAEINKRLKIAKREMAEAKHYDYTIVNPTIDGGADELRAIIMAERLRNR